MSSPSNGVRLGTAVKHRRLDVFRGSMDEFAAQVGVHKRTIQAIELAERQITNSTKHRLERALYWKTGSVDRILAGGDPVELPLPAPEASPLSALGPAELVAQISERLTELARRIPDRALTPSMLDPRIPSGAYIPPEVDPPFGDDRLDEPGSAEQRDA